MAKRKPSGRGGRKRRGQGEDMTGAEAGQVEVRTPLSIDDVDLDDADIKVHFNAIKTATERKDTAVSGLRTAKKRANDTCAGLSDEIEHVMKLQRKNDPSAYARKMKVRNRVLGALGFPVQLEIFDTLAGDHMEQVYRRYFEDGKSGKALDNRYPVGTDMAAQAARAWRHGMAAQLGVTPQQADADLEEGIAEVESRLPPPPTMTAQSQLTQH